MRQCGIFRLSPHGVARAGPETSDWASRLEPPVGPSERRFAGEGSEVFAVAPVVAGMVFAVPPPQDSALTILAGEISTLNCSHQITTLP